MKNKIHSARPIKLASHHTRQATPMQPAYPPPPSEETLLRLNAIAKQAPFCYYYQEKTNDCL